jgi:hypothetical protein
MPVCPYCGSKITKLYSNRSRDLKWQGRKWIRGISLDGAIIACSVCYEELGPKDLDKLNVANELR